MTKGKQYTHETLMFLKGFFLFLGLSSGITVVMGFFIYILYRVAIYSRHVYTFVFVSALAMVIFYFLCRTAKKGKLLKVFLSFLRIIAYTGVVLLILGMFLSYGAFTVRYPWIGLPISPFFVVGIIMFIFRLKPISNIKKLFIIN